MPAKQPIDWHRLYAEEHPQLIAVDSRRRLRICLAGFVVLLAVVAARAVFLEVSQGEAFRAEASQPLINRRDLQGTRGRIIAADGTVLAHDRAVSALAVKYRYLEEPPNRRWLDSTVRSRLSKTERKDRRRLAAEEALVLAEQRRSVERTAALCGLSLEEWFLRARRIQSRVERISQDVNGRRREEFNRHVTVAEELKSHVMVDNVSTEAAAEICFHPERYPGVTIIEHTQRFYPRGSLAAHVLGYLGKASEEEAASDAARPEGRLYHADDRRGRAGLEFEYEAILHGRRGELVETADQGGRLLYSQREIEPGTGRDIVLTIQPRLQETAERLLDDALRRRKIVGAEPPQAGGAIAVMDVENGGLLAAASAPRFDPNDFSGGDSSGAGLALDDPARPMFDRATSMAVAPGSVFKTVAAVTFLEEGVVAADEPFACQGYLESPQSLRCDIFKRLGVGHGPVAMTDALAQSCNVYFFHHATALDPGRLEDWAGRLGFGRKTGVDLPGESAGHLPKNESGESSAKNEKRRLHDARMLAVGQGSLTATPLQVVRLMAALANGGRLVRPHVVGCVSTHDTGEDATQWCVKTRPTILETIRRGLGQAVSDEKGTAHDTLAGTDATVACKTGTAETGGGRSAHAWAAGFTPADKPRYAFVIVIEHGGDGGEAACPVAKRLIVRMEQLGLL